MTHPAVRVQQPNMVPMTLHTQGRRLFLTYEESRVSYTGHDFVPRFQL